jgi:hypothetical protein
MTSMLSQDIHVRRFRENSLSLGNISITMLNDWQRRSRASSRSVNELIEVLLHPGTFHV